MSVPEEAVALFIDAELTKHQHISVQSQVTARHADIYQLYHVVKESKSNVILKKIPCKAAKHMQKLSCNHY
jgi:hypothetical protein